MDLPSIVCYEGGPTFSGVSLFALSLSLRHRMQFQSSKAPETSGTERRLIMFLIQTSKQNCLNYGGKKKRGGGGALRSYLCIQEIHKKQNHFNFHDCTEIEFGNLKSYM